MKKPHIFIILASLMLISWATYGWYNNYDQLAAIKSGGVTPKRLAGKVSKYTKTQCVTDEDCRMGIFVTRNIGRTILKATQCLNHADFVGLQEENLNINPYNTKSSFCGCINYTYKKESVNYCNSFRQTCKTDADCDVLTTLPEEQMYINGFPDVTYKCIRRECRRYIAKPKDGTTTTTTTAPIAVPNQPANNDYEMENPYNNLDYNSNIPNKNTEIVQEIQPISLPSGSMGTKR